jgi:heat shock protein HslJ
MSRRVLWSVTVLAALALLAAGCGDDGDEGAGDTGGGGSTTAPSDAADTAGPGGDDPLAGRTFLATQVTGHDLVPGSELRLTFDGDLLVVAAGCNSMRSGYAFDGGRLAWTGNPAATMMACEPELMAQDEWMAGLLTAGVEAEVAGDDLVLTSGDVRIELVAEPAGGAADGAAGSSPSLYGTTWTLTSIIDGEGASSVPAGVEPPTLVFAEDGSVGLFTGCNSGSTSVEITDTTAVFAPPVTTLIGCDGDAGVVEAAVLAVVDGQVDLVVDGDQLTLGKGEDGLAFTAGPA